MGVWREQSKILTMLKEIQPNIGNLYPVILPFKTEGEIVAQRLRDFVISRLALQESVTIFRKKEMIEIWNLDPHKERRRVREGINESKAKSISLFLWLIDNYSKQNQQQCIRRLEHLDKWNKCYKDQERGMGTLHYKVTALCLAHHITSNNSVICKWT